MAEVEASLSLDISGALADIEQLAAAVDDALSSASVEIEADASALDDVASAIEELDATVEVGVDADTAAVEADLAGIEAAAPDSIDIPVEVPGAAEAEQEIQGLGDSVEGLQGALAGLGAVGLGAGLGAVLSAFGEADAVIAQTNQLIETTGGVANVTAGDVSSLATAIQDYSGASDETVAQAQNILLTFRQIRNEGEGAEAIFDRATVALQDLSTVFGGDAASNAVKLGRALQDPVRGLTALGRQGVTFTQEQKDLVTSLVETGQTLEAQQIILDEIEGQVGGAARAYGETFPGAVDKAQEALGNVLEVIGASAAEIAGPLVGAVTGLSNGFLSLDPAVQEVVAGMGAFVLAAGTAAGAAVALRAAAGSELAASLAASARSLQGMAAGGLAFAAANPAVAAAALVVALGGLAIATGHAESAEGALSDLGDQLQALAEENADAVSSLDALGEGVLEATGLLVGLGAAIQEVNLLSVDLAGSTTSLFDIFFTANPAIEGINNLLGVLDPKAAGAADATNKLADAEGEAAAQAQALASTLPTVAEAFNDVQSAAPALAEEFGILNAATDPSILAANIQQQADLLNVFFVNLNSIADAGFDQLAGTLQEIGPEAAGLAFQLAAALESGDVVEAARLQNAISNLEDASGRITGLGTETGAGFSDAAQAAITTGAEAVGAAADAAGNSAAQGLARGYQVAVALITVQMSLVVATVAAQGVTLATTSGQVGQNSGRALSQGFLATAPSLIGLAMSSVSIQISSAAIGIQGSARSAGFGIGSALGQGIRSGLDSQISGIVSTARNAVNEAEAAARSAADANSPSKLFAALGADMGDGIAVGLARAQRSVVAEAEALTFAAAGGAAGDVNVGGVAVYQTINGNAGDPRTMRRASREGLSAGVAKMRQRTRVDVKR